MDDETRLVKEPWLAVLLSRILPGVGQFYAGAWRSGLAILVLFLLLIVGAALEFCLPRGNMIHGLILLGLGAAVAIVNLFHAHRCARKRNPALAEEIRTRSKDPYLAAFLTDILPGIGHLYLRWWLVGIALVLVSLAIWTFGQPDSPAWWGRALFILEPPYTALICLLVLLAARAEREAPRKMIATLCLLFLGAGLLVNGSVMLVQRYAIQAFSMDTSPMAPTIQAGDRILARKLCYEPRRGDVIVFHCPDQRDVLYCMRVAAFSDETVEVRDGGVYVDGVRLTGDPWDKLRHVSLERPRQEFAATGKPYTVPAPGQVFVLGDNSERSRDSRFFGPVPAGDIVGKAYKCYWPLDRAGPIE